MNKKEEKISKEISFGKNNVKELIENKNVSKVFLQKGGRYKDILTLINKKKIPYVFVEKFYLDHLTENGTHQGIVAEHAPIAMLEIEDVFDKYNSEENPLFLILDEVQDPQNLGAIIRNADAFGVSGIVFNKRRSAQLTGTVAKVSTGAINYVDMIRVNNLRQAIKKLKDNGYWIGYLDMDGEIEVSKYNYDGPLAIVIGGEDKGVTDNIKKECDFGLNIEMKGHVNSLNVASAVAILCYQKK